MLKAFGMTLAQIRTLLATKTPPIARVLQMQLRACNARKNAAADYPVEPARPVAQHSLAAGCAG